MNPRSAHHNAPPECHKPSHLPRLLQESSPTPRDDTSAMSPTLPRQQGSLLSGLGLGDEDAGLSYQQGLTCGFRLLAYLQAWFAAQFGAWA